LEKSESLRDALKHGDREGELRLVDKRAKKRRRAQLQVRFGISDLDRIGITENISEGGLFIRTAITHPRNTILRIAFITPAGESIELIGKVRWLRRLPPAVRPLGEMSGMGIQIQRFVSGLGFFIAMWQGLEGENRDSDT
jgi:hypothetical protein